MAAFATLTKATCPIYSLKKMNFPTDTKENFLPTVLSFRGSWLTGAQVKTRFDKQIEKHGRAQLFRKPPVREKALPAGHPGAAAGRPSAECLCMVARVTQEGCGRQGREACRYQGKTECAVITTHTLSQRGAKMR